VPESQLQALPENASKEEKSSPDAKSEASFQDNLISKINENETGKVLLDALIKKSIEDRYGKKEIREILAISTGKLAVIDVLKGSGAELLCGAEAIIKYDAYMSNGLIFDSTTSKNTTAPLTIQTGKNQVIKGLEAGIIGMKEGGRRKISIPSGLGFNLPGFENTIIPKDEAISYEVELVSVKDGVYKNASDVIVQREIPGSGRQILCGDKARIKYNFKDKAGRQLTEQDAEAEFVLGSGNVPLGLEMAVYEMKTGGKKSFRLSDNLLKTSGKTVLPKALKFKEGDVIQADIELLN
jgi:FKBP-type peptidyl-prolyl cis-trans isomerase